MLLMPLFLTHGAPIDDMQTYKTEVKKVVSGRYLVALPEGYETQPRKRWPLVLFLHGSGERGSDIEKVKIHGPLKEIAAGRKIEAVVIVPQCDDGSFWDADSLLGLINVAERKYRIDKDRETVTGLSMGGFGTWDLLAAAPNRFAAAAPICGGGNPAKVATYAHVPLWITHGDQDGAVNIGQSIVMVDALKAAGASPRFDKIVGGGHDVWTNVYNRDDFWAWLLSQKRTKR